MKVNLENSNEILSRARNLAKSKEIPDIEEAARLFKIYSATVPQANKRIVILQECFDVSLKLISQNDVYDKKFWQFKIASFVLVEMLKLTKNMKNEEIDKTKSMIANCIKDFYGAFGHQKVICYEYYCSSHFKKIVNEKFGDSLLQGFLSQQKSEISQSLSKNLPSSVDIYEPFRALCDSTFNDVQNSTLSLRPVSSEYFVPISPEMIKEVNQEDPVDKQFFDEFSKELKSAASEGKEAFYRFLLRNYQIQIKNGVILNDFDSDVLSYTKEIVDYFFQNSFTDPTELKIVKLIQMTLRQLRWLS